MKTKFFLVLLLISSLLSFSQKVYDTMYLKEWNEKTKTWEKFDRVISVTDQKYKLSELVQIFVGEEWLNYSFRAYYYDQNNRLTLETEQFWNDELLRWRDSFILHYKYNDSGFLSELIHQNIYNGIAREDMREQITYFPDGKQKERTIIRNNKGKWENFIKTGYRYIDQRLEEEVVSYWNHSGWEMASSEYDYIYNEYGQLTERIKYQITSKKPEKTFREQYLYDTYGHLNEIVSFEWNTRKKLWNETNRRIMCCDGEGKIVTSVCQVMRNGSWINTVFTEFPENYIPELTNPMTRSISFCLSNGYDTNETVINFDNPDHEKYLVRVVDSDGNLINSSLLSGNEIILDTRQLTSGVYFVELSGKDSFSGKFYID